MDKIEYLDFREVPFEGKTKRIEVWSKWSGYILARIQYHPPWRKYVMLPAYPTIWNDTCLDEIQTMLRKLNDERKDKKKVMDVAS